MVMGSNIIKEWDSHYIADNYFNSMLNANERNVTKIPEKQASAHAIQIDLQCCGFTYEGYFKYKDLTEKVVELVPYSCCIEPTEVCSWDEIWADNCMQFLELLGMKTLSTIGAILLCLALQCFIVVGVGYVFGVAIRQYYYY